MSKKRDNTWKRFQSWWQLRKELGPWLQKVEHNLEVLSRSRDMAVRPFIKSLLRHRIEDFLGFLRVQDTMGVDVERSIRKACEDFGLDPTKPRDRNIMLGIFADIHYPNLEDQNYHESWYLGRREMHTTTAPEYRAPAPPGAPRFWTDDHAQMFTEDIVKARNGPPKTTVTESVARRLQKPEKFGPFKLDYAKFQLPVLKKYIRSSPHKRACSSKNLERK
jgi:hypothetical protein